MKTGGWILAAVIAGGVISIHFKTVANLKSEIADLRAEIRSGETSAPAHTAERPRPSQPSLGTLPQRVSHLELAVADLAKTSDFLVQRGMVPPSARQTEQMQAKFFDPAASDGERLRALRLLRRNGQVTDEVALQAMGWLQSSTNGNIRRELLRNLDGMTNSIMKEPLLALLGTENNGNVREELVDVLADFVSDPGVEQKLWQLALHDPSGEVREEAQDALADGRMTPERVNSLRERAANPNLALDERLLAMRGLREADAEMPEVLSEMTKLAQSSTDPVTRAKLFQAFDGINDPSLMAPLVSGLQDPNPVVRERAADALGSFASDPRIKEWLNHIIQNDTDPRVKREAHQALEQGQRRRRGRD